MIYFFLIYLNNDRQTIKINRKKNNLPVIVGIVFWWLLWLWLWWWLLLTKADNVFCCRFVFGWLEMARWQDDIWPGCMIFVLIICSLILQLVDSGCKWCLEFANVNNQYHDDDEGVWLFEWTFWSNIRSNWFSQCCCCCCSCCFCRLSLFAWAVNDEWMSLERVGNCFFFFFFLFVAF